MRTQGRTEIKGRMWAGEGERDGPSKRRGEVTGPVRAENGAELAGDYRGRMLCMLGWRSCLWVGKIKGEDYLKGQGILGKSDELITSLILS